MNADGEATPLVGTDSSSKSSSSWRRLILMATTLAGLVMLAHSPLRGKSRGTAELDVTKKDKTQDSSDFLVTITLEDFLKFDKVVEFLETKGLSADSPDWLLLDYIPSKVVITGSPMLIQGGGKQGEMGDLVMEGLTTWGMQHKNVAGDWTASYNMVMDMRGNIVAITPTMLNLGGSYHCMSMKPYTRNPSYILCGVDSGTVEAGPVYLWNWDGSTEKEWVNLANNKSVDCHDVSMSYTDDYIWSAHRGGAATDHVAFEKVSVTTGTAVGKYEFDLTFKDVNHVQLIDKDATAIVSDRSGNFIMKAGVEDKKIKWILGGSNGTLSLIDEDGTKFPENHEFFLGQHNVDYIGDDTYLLFDDQTEVTTKANVRMASESRLLELKVDEDALSAKITWSFGVGAWTPIFGDNDHLVTGNRLAVMWVGSLNCDNWDTDDDDNCDAVGHDAQVMEIDRDTKDIAWSVRIFSNTTQKYSNVDAGWSIYSAERFYETPLIWSITCAETDDGDIVVGFSSASAFKRNSNHPAKYKIFNHKEHRVSSGNFDWKPFWRQTHVEAVDSGLTECKGYIQLVDEVTGQKTGRVHFTS